MTNIIYCRDCKFRHKASDWKYCENNGISVWCCDKGRGIDNLTQTIDLDDFCSSAEKIIKCEKCGKRFDDKMPNFCPNCGADMRGDEE